MNDLHEVNGFKLSLKLIETNKTINKSCYNIRPTSVVPYSKYISVYLNDCIYLFGESFFFYWFIRCRNSSYNLADFPFEFF